MLTKRLPGAALGSRRIRCGRARLPDARHGRLHARRADHEGARHPADAPRCCSHRWIAPATCNASPTSASPAYLTKPVRTRELLDCLNRALSREARGSGTCAASPSSHGARWSRTEVEPITRVACCWSKTTPINQRVARRFLERLGCEVHVVGDGEAGRRRLSNATATASF